MRDPEGHKLKTARNRQYGAEALRRAGVPFESHNKEAHLIVSVAGTTIDYWPGTGLWIERSSGQRCRGIQGLLKRCKQGKETP